MGASLGPEATTEGLLLGEQRETTIVAASSVCLSIDELSVYRSMKTRTPKDPPGHSQTNPNAAKNYSITAAQTKAASRLGQSCFASELSVTYPSLRPRSFSASEGRVDTRCRSI